MSDYEVVVAALVLIAAYLAITFGPRVLSAIGAWHVRRKNALAETTDYYGQM